MKIFTSTQIHELDKYTIDHEPVSSINLMERAAKAITHLKQLLGINQEVEGRHIIIVEDIVDTGFTMQKMIDSLKEKNPASINVCSLLVKPGNLRVPLDIKYAVMEIPNDFIVGYGLDYDQQGRNLRDIYTIVED